MSEHYTGWSKHYPDETQACVYRVLDRGYVGQTDIMSYRLRWREWAVNNSDGWAAAALFVVGIATTLRPRGR